jgi:anti-anti-sigma regulatory factor
MIEARNERHLVLEGKLITPWTHELRSACERARVDLGDRALVVDLKNVTVISPEGEETLSALMSEGVKFRCCGVFTSQVLRQITRKLRARR